MSKNGEQENTRDSKDDFKTDTGTSKDDTSTDVGKDGEPDTVSDKDDVGKDAEPDTGSSKDEVSTNVGKDGEPDTGSSKDEATSGVGKDGEPDTGCGKDGCQPELPQINSVWSVDGKNGSLSDSGVKFFGGISLNDGTFELTNNSVKQNTDRFTIKGTISPEADHIGKPADIVVVAFHRPDPDNLSCDPTVEPDGSGYYMFTRGGDNYLDNYCIWDVDVPTDFKDQYKGTKLPQQDDDRLVICRRFEEGQKGKNGQGKNGEERPRKGTRSAEENL
ncbi:MAG TPA: hypothetical protein EYP59_13400, partial [Thiotrichaceae bacterium]|nr:hypothetical protein [Thiotrichaceae bacterium]